MRKGALRLFGGFAMLMLLAGGVAHAETTNFKESYSGTNVNVPVDQDSDSCFTGTNGSTVCTDTSLYNDFAGRKSPGGGFTGQNVVELDPVSGTSCNILGTTVPGIASCTLAGRSEHGCKFRSVGDTEVDRDNSSGDLLFVTRSDTVCLDLSSGPPFNFAGRTTGTITGGTGKNTGATGTITMTGHGQALTSDKAGHGFGWFETSFTGTITTP
jgi:hypothetical protein